MQRMNADETRIGRVSLLDFFLQSSAQALLGAGRIFFFYVAATAAWNDAFPSRTEP
jgi:hypothetical protein